MITNEKYILPAAVLLLAFCCYCGGEQQPVPVPEGESDQAAVDSQTVSIIAEGGPGSGVLERRPDPSGLVAVITLTAARDLPAGSPVSVNVEDLTEQLSPTLLHLREQNQPGRPGIPIQIEASAPPRLWWLLPSGIKSGDVRLFDLCFGSPESLTPVQLKLHQGALDLCIQENEVLRYHHAERPPPPGEDPHYRRSGFIHPVWSPSGAVLTRIHPSDHIHHLGFWWPWTLTEYQSREIDFWNLGKGEGTVRFVQFEHLETGPVFGGFTAHHHYVDLQAASGEEIVLHELCHVRLWNLAETEPAIRIWDLSITQWPAASHPLTVKKYRYGGFGFRATADWNPENSAVLTSEGRDRENGNGTRVKWISASGVTDRGTAGILMMDHPSNARHPEPVRIWPEGDVFVGFCPVVEQELIILPGERDERIYRILTCDREVDTAWAELHWGAYAGGAVTEFSWIEEN